uniref:Putative gomdanji n=1 Tax=Corethrella appendiculata TaxID=1370023 RepID=U5ETH2_9DIPT
MLPIRPIANLALRNAAFISRGYQAGGQHHQITTVNDLPTPEGDFFEHHNKKQTKYNATLAAGILIFGITLTIAKESGLIYLNFYPPKSID